MDIMLSDNQINQFSLEISIDDVLDCIRKDYDSYLDFLNNELNSKRISEKEYKKELKTIEELRKQRSITI